MAKHNYPKGLYEVELLKGQRFDQLATGTDLFEIDFRVEARFDAATRQKVELPKEEQFPRKTTIWLTEKAKPQSIPRLKALGVEGNLRQYDPTREGFVCLAGRKVKMFCDGQDDKGYDKWSVFVPSDKARAPRPAKAGVASKLDNLWGNALGATKREETAPVTTTEAQGEPSLPW